MSKSSQSSSALASLGSEIAQKQATAAIRPSRTALMPLHLRLTSLSSLD